MVPLFANNIII